MEIIFKYWYLFQDFRKFSAKYSNKSQAISAKILHPKIYQLKHTRMYKIKTIHFPIL